MRIAILGATSHIAKNIVFYLSKEKEYSFYLYARDLRGLEEFLKDSGLVINSNSISVFPLQEFGSQAYDVIINCIGFADPIKQRNAGNDILTVTELYDNLIISYLQKKRDTKYISFSSGAVFGSDFTTPVADHSKAIVDVNHVVDGDFYQTSKLYSEIKHRSLPELAIVDLRIYGFFSRFIDLNAGYLLCQIIRSVRAGVHFNTDRTDIVRDYVSPRDLTSLIKPIIDSSTKINTALDVYSKGIVKKTEILELFVENYGLEVEYKEGDYTSATGVKPFYYSTSDFAYSLYGYEPKESSLECIMSETEKILQ